MTLRDLLAKDPRLAGSVPLTSPSPWGEGRAPDSRLAGKREEALPWHEA
jgi:hypothetical protein